MAAAWTRCVRLGTVFIGGDSAICLAHFGEEEFDYANA